MTKLVKHKKDIRRTYLATFDRYSVTKNFYRGRKYNMIFRDLYDLDSGKKANYVIFDCIKNFEKLNLKYGDAVTFRARDIVYLKQWPNFNYDNPSNACVRLMNPTQGKKLVKPVKRITYNNDISEYKEKYYQVKVNY